jgi:hypothetical protein
MPSADSWDKILEIRRQFAEQGKNKTQTAMSGRNVQNISFSEWQMAKQNRGPYERKILIADLPNLPNKAFTDVSSLATRISVSYTMDLASELSFEIVDPNLQMAEKNYFTLTRDVIYQTQTLGRIQPYEPNIVFVQQLFEIANVTVSQGPGMSPNFSIKCYTKAIQQMKRDRKSASSIKGTGTEFVRNAAAKFGLAFYGQQTSKSQQVKSSGNKQADSLWDIMKRLSDDAKFVLFEVDGLLIFGSEEWLIDKWGNNSMVIPKTKNKKVTKKVLIGYEEDKGKNSPIYKTVTEVKKETVNKTVRFISLQFPNSGENYIGREGIFNLTEHPSITKSDNDPREADGSCTVERINGTQIRPGMTAYVGNIPWMSGYYLIDSVSYNEMAPDPVSVTFRTQQRDEEKYKKKELPVGIRYIQTYADTEISVRAVQDKTRNSAGQSQSGIRQDARLFPFPQAAGQLDRYPRMEYADLTIAYPAFINLITNDKITEKSTGDRNSLIYAGNLDLYTRPVLPDGNENPKTIYSYTITEPYGSEYRAILLPLIYTQNNVAVTLENSLQEVEQKFWNAGGYEGSGKHLGVLRGTTKKDAIRNARDYAKLISLQQTLVLKHRFPQYANSVGGLGTIPNTPGGSDSLWI